MTEEDSRSRRMFLAGGLGAASAAALALAGCSGSKPLRVKIRNGAKVVPGDVGSLNALLDLENYAIAAYTAGIPLLGRPAAKAAKQFLAQELAHALALSELIKRAGAKPEKPRSSYNLGQPRDAAEAVALLQRLERAQLSAYLALIPRLTPGRVRSATAAIFANDAQHLAVLRSVTGQSAIPTAFATG